MLRSLVGSEMCIRDRILLDLAFFELDMFTSNWVVFFQDKLFRHRPSVLFRDVEKTSVRCGIEADFNSCWLGHGPYSLRGLVKLRGISNRAAEHTEARFQVKCPASSQVVEVFSNPCIRLAHCKPTIAPFILGKSQMVGMMMAGNQMANCKPRGGS